MAETGYNVLDRILHRLVLQFRPIAELSFELDQRVVETDPAEIIPRRHVFVSGLARAGTTMLMRRFYATGLFRSLTYRDMPAVREIVRRAAVDDHRFEAIVREVVFSDAFMKRENYLVSAEEAGARHSESAGD